MASTSESPTSTVLSKEETGWLASMDTIIEVLQRTTDQAVSILGVVEVPCDKEKLNLTTNSEALAWLLKHKLDTMWSLAADLRTYMNWIHKKF